MSFVFDSRRTYVFQGTMFTTPYETERRYRLYFPEIPANGDAVNMKIDIYWSPLAKEDHSPGRKRVTNWEEAGGAGPKDHLQDDVFLWGYCVYLGERPFVRRLELSNDTERREESL